MDNVSRIFSDFMAPSLTMLKEPCLDKSTIVDSHPSTICPPSSIASNPFKDDDTI